MLIHDFGNINPSNIIKQNKNSFGKINKNGRQKILRIFPPSF
jgi:hypothetical protein